MRMRPGSAWTSVPLIVIVTRPSSLMLSPRDRRADRWLSPRDRRSRGLTGVAVDARGGLRADARVSETGSMCSGAGEREMLVPEGTPPTAHVLLELVPEQLDVGAKRPRGGVTQRAKGSYVDAVGDVQQQVHVLAPALAALDALEDLHRPPRALPARGALTAGLVLEELSGYERVAHHARRLVHEHDGARTEHRS